MIFRAGLAAGIEAQQMDAGEKKNLKILDDENTLSIGERVLGDFLCTCDFSMPATSGKKLSYHAKGCRVWTVLEEGNRREQ